MPSLWKKQKGNRISRLVADLQTTPKRGGSLVVETGFPTSLVDLFVKNRDKLKKPKTKKHKSNKLSAISEDVDDGHIFSPVSNPPVSNYDLEVPICSIVEDCEENVDQIDENDLFVEETVTHKNPVVELHHDVCKNENNNNNNEEIRETLEVSNSKNVALLSIFIGVLVFIVVLYTKRWFLALITLGFLVLLLLEYVGNSVFRLFKPCENAVSMSVVKGALVVVVALYTKWFVVGITIGASLLLLLEYAGNSAFGGFKPCQDAKWKLKDILPHWVCSKKRRDFDERKGRKGGRGVLMRAVLIGSKREVYCNERFDWVSRIDFNDEGVGNEGISNRDIKLENGNDHTSNRENDLVVEDDGDDVSLKEENEEGSGDSSPANEDRLFEEETQNKSMYEMLSLELNYPIYPRTSNFSGHDGNFDQQGEKGTMEEGGKGSEDTSISRKYKKSKKFWKNFVSKKMSKKKKYKDGREDDNAAHIDNIVDTATEVEEEDEQEDGDQEISEIEESTSVTDDENEREIENLSTAYSCYTETLQTDDITTKSSGIVKEKYGNLKYLTAMVIPLTGLIGGRMFAVVVTIICCLVFKMVRG